MPPCIRKLFALGLAASALLASGCASLNPPDADKMAHIPTIRFGETAPTGQEFILHYPAGSPLPVTSSVRGSLLDRPEQATLHVRLKRDVFLYRQWFSFDGKSWMPGHDAVSGKIAMKLPGETDGKSPGELSAEFNLNPNLKPSPARE